MTDRFRIRPSDPGDDDIGALADLLVDCVEGGASVSLVQPFDRGRAESFWTDVLASAARRERVVLVAEESDTGAVVGTVQVVLSVPENQPHRGEVAKMLVHRRARRHGLGTSD